MTTKKTAASAAAVMPKGEASIAIRTPEVIAAEIRFIDNQARQYVLQSAIEIGQKLTEAKALVAHGEWGAWLQNHVSYSQSTANNFMRVSVEYGKSQTLGNLSYSQAVALLSVPAEERESFAEEVGASELSTRELQAAIKAREEAERQLEEAKRKQAEQKARFDDWAATQQDELRKMEERHRLSAELRDAADKQVAELTEELEKAKAAGNSKEIAKVKAELRKAEKDRQAQEKKADGLQQQLEAMKAKAEQETADALKKLEQSLKSQAEQERKALQERLDAVETQLSRNNNESYLTAKLQLKQLHAIGDTLLKAIASVKEPEEQAKLKHAAATIVDQLRGTLG